MLIETHLFFQQQLKKLNNHRIKKITKFAKKNKNHENKKHSNWHFFNPNFNIV